MAAPLGLPRRGWVDAGGCRGAAGAGAALAAFAGPLRTPPPVTPMLAPVRTVTARPGAGLAPAGPGPVGGWPPARPGPRRSGPPGGCPRAPGRSRGGAGAPTGRSSLPRRRRRSMRRRSTGSPPGDGRPPAQRRAGGGIIARALPRGQSRGAPTTWIARHPGPAPGLGPTVPGASHKPPFSPASRAKRRHGTLCRLSIVPSMATYPQASRRFRVF